MAPQRSGEVQLVTSENAESFFSNTDKPLKAILFTKKTETPNLWLRVAEAQKERCIFGEIRDGETSLMGQFGMTEDVLPKVVAVRSSTIPGQVERIVYDGPNDLERICEFLHDAIEGGPLVVELRREVQDLNRELRGLRAEAQAQADAVEAARAETARAKLGQVGQVDAVRKRLEGELAEVQARESSLTQRLASLEEEHAAAVAGLTEERDSMVREVAAIKEVHERAVVEICAGNYPSFQRSTVRPLKALLVTTKPDVPLLWQQLAEAQTLTTSFGIVRHTDAELLALLGTPVETLPRILLYANGEENPIVYSGIVTFEAISSYLEESVSGGEVCMDLRNRLDQAIMAEEAARDECAKVLKAAEASAEERDRTHGEEVRGLRDVIESLKKQLKDACAGAGEELRGVRMDTERRFAEAAAINEGLKQQLLAERAATRQAVQEAVIRLEADHRLERSEWEEALQGAEEVESQITALTGAVRATEKAVVRAASAVHVTLVRSARENERMRSSLSEFISDVAPAQIEPSLAYDPAAAQRMA
eukprot:CAMPEP_0169445612 /NCGR_PEP_ID=MMETSP1042-20121227/10532_1 /TAXON_ID=464988 /ORGANISM="Hemiselmis andersenii, Strain CCMP1180" /LENGTH=536 /DNA_ID=CAMNT_0009557019 /DNA_START=19 /DNA_END=1626 /DNA_ORIENTATION=+